ncbi:hypothetical protein TNIN_197051 [Trichonephila inaurata madagascariensis]|uniref:Uncharacterized protein n=1 Tax=Trichonephila inaurata madagascariensis TaxID=2747483 RepID=A0A8X7CK71_9ARAC|nr:hypothetical protein TNIN_197051 [Trichonephila inaurata madagascariensis]
MSKESDKTEKLDNIGPLGHCDDKVSETSTNLDIEEVEILIQQLTRNYRKKVIHKRRLFQKKCQKRMKHLFIKLKKGKLNLTVKDVEKNSKIFRI